MFLLVHLAASYFLIFMMMSSLIVTLARDPGPIRSLEAMESHDTSGLGQGQERQEVGLTEALLTDVSIPLKTNGEPRWCRKVRYIRLDPVSGSSASSIFSAGPQSRKEHIIVPNAIDVYLEWVRNPSSRRSCTS